MPLPLINSLEIPKRQKRLLLVVFGMGLGYVLVCLPGAILTNLGSTCLVSVFRLTFLQPISHSPDMAYESPLNNVFAGLEANVAILASCLPTLNGAVQRFNPKLLELLRSARKSSRNASDASPATNSTFELPSWFKGKSHGRTVDPESGLRLSEKPASGLARWSFR
jgi:hypothetical protein